LSFTQLNPQIPVVTPKGAGWAFAVIDRSQEHPIEFVVSQDAGGEVWVWFQQDVRIAANQTYHRTPDYDF
jgi:hypothetical protein